ncbi:flagellar hook-basal body complex protein [Heliobacillus mobilis]|uniref:Flagellar hook protein FlgE n=1 Tax=Heliobacterium mobile TaxID=28064 RepID=A0A6I3SBU4_HELMO|nr:flagellar hook protein FlgE [Heliobacterium mobile]MTV47802.1 flagellar hook-basal body complex protein [Heliobacterium mobile]
MMRSLFSAVTALRNHQTRMDVIGNNIANVNTIGFKKSRVTFSDTLNQTIRGASSGDDGGRGGTNPMQVGLGMNVATIEMIPTATSVQGTGKNSDLAINGDGFFLLNDGGTQYYTRAGNFDLDNKYNFIRTDNGMKVMGYMADENGDIATTKSPVEISLEAKQNMKAYATNRVEFYRNLGNTDGKNTPIPKTIEIFDSQGQKHNLVVSFKNNGSTTPNQWIVSAVVVSGTTVLPGIIKGTLAFSSNGIFKSFTVTSASSFSFHNGTDDILTMPTTTYSANYKYPSSTTDKKLYLDLSKMTQFASETTADKLSQNGYADGSLKSYAIDSSGTLTGVFSNGKTMKLAQVAVSSFSNPAGLMKAGSNLYTKSNNCGEESTGTPGSASRGDIQPGALEMSNVDLSQEFTDMITTQRGFQANSRIITVSDSMLEELVNLKR